LADWEPGLVLRFSDPPSCSHFELSLQAARAVDRIR